MAVPSAMATKLMNINGNISICTSICSKTKSKTMSLLSIHNIRLRRMCMTSLFVMLN